MKAGWRAWGRPAKPVGQVALAFPGGRARMLENLSAGTRIGETLFVGADERDVLNRLVPQGDAWNEEGSCALGDLLPVADPGEEVDLEGLAADGDWLWVLGSHAHTRPKPEKAPDERIDLDALAALNDTRARCLLARIPLVAAVAGEWLPVPVDGDRRAGMLRQGRHGNALGRALRRDPLLGPFARVPAKEGGVDIEGIAVCDGRVALGMRGPVIGGHALLLELELAAKRSGRLQIASPPVKRLLALEGLGIRDLKRCDDDLLILAGPTTGLSGPCALYRWQGWANDPAHDARHVRLHRPERLLELPFGRGADHPEGLALWEDGPGGERRILVIYDSPDPARIDAERRTVTADIFQLPA